MKEVKRLRFGLGFQVETDKGPVDLYSVNADEDVSGTYVQSIDYDDLLRELAAHVERLKCVALAYYTNGVCVQDVKNILAETPAQSLEAVKRESAGDAINKFLGCVDVEMQQNEKVVDCIPKALNRYKRQT